MQLFYFSEISESTTHFSFHKEESKHIVKVLRKKEGDLLRVTNGKGLLFTTQVINAKQSGCEVEVTQVEKFENTRSYHLQMVVAPTKSNDRTEWFLEKATELGVDEFSFLACTNSERKVIKEERFEKVVLSAMKQSLQLHLPEVNPLQDFESFVKKTHLGQRFIAHCYDTPKQNLWDAIETNVKEVVILIGPEGDFSEEEVELAIHHGFTPVSLSPNRLRTETAALVAVHTINLKFQ